MSTFKKFSNLEKEAPPKPEFTCPSIDDFISQLEELRQANAALRDTADYWKDLCLELHDMVLELQECKKEIKRYIKDI